MVLKEIFEVAGILLIDKGDMVQKGYGWMLKAPVKQTKMRFLFF
ncbi:DNA alkylation repair protein [Shivajiella indica]|uniref:DNA alkylation repair protein n=1 Tax=Shivajiella indica TaxID=872115 RepID=A0ABW5BB22_9BACT